MTSQYGTFKQATEQCPRSFASELSARLERELAQSQSSTNMPARGYKASHRQNEDRSPSDVESGRSSTTLSVGRWKKHFLEDVKVDQLLAVQLLVLTLATGVLDAVSVSTYQVFVSKQTGNTVLGALWAVRHPHVDLEENIGTSFGFFVLGATVFGQLSHIFRPRRRIWLILSMSLQALIVYAAAALAHYVSEERTGVIALAVISMLSFTSGGQMCLAVNVNVPEINTTLITGALMQLATDGNFFKYSNPARNRRCFFVAAFFLGALIGATITKLVRPSFAILLDAILKTVVCLTFLVNDGEGSQSVDILHGKIPPLISQREPRN